MKPRRFLVLICPPRTGCCWRWLLPGAVLSCAPPSANVRAVLFLRCVSLCVAAARRFERLHFQARQFSAFGVCETTSSSALPMRGCLLKLDDHFAEHRDCLRAQISGEVGSERSHHGVSGDIHGDLRGVRHLCAGGRGRQHAPFFLHAWPHCRVWLRHGGLAGETETIFLCLLDHDSTACSVIGSLFTLCAPKPHKSRWSRAEELVALVQYAN